MDSINSYLKVGAIKLDACGKEIDTWESNLSKEELANKFSRAMHFCAEKNFPDSNFLVENYDHEFLVSCGVYVNAVGYARPTAKRVTVMGNSDVSMRFCGYDVVALFVRNDSKVNISVSNRAIVYVRAYDDAVVKIDNLSKESSVKVFKNSKSAKIHTSGNVKMIINEQETFS